MERNRINKNKKKVSVPWLNDSLQIMRSKTRAYRSRFQNETDEKCKDYKMELKKLRTLY